ncbi:DUF4974 domain-containing protein [Echinicola jeungdonensis]|uniref:FecR family protein n=1 Tax=Echinicola jeungdonensis TaxID=709343 RepID=A0ABV5J3T9_9BACT|nr:FecR domain-containing protein [Echinicola jeungdonensis]MDN3669325.1 DUF4974 domain-containing protein [Echinicola jeungdonensis]
MKQKQSEIFQQLISRKDFVDWVKHPNGDRNQFWDKWQKEHPEDISALREAREFVLRLSFQQNHMENEELEGMLGKIIAKDSPKEVKGNMGHLYREPVFQWAKVAAILLICLLGSYIIQNLTFSSLPHEEVMAWKSVKNPRGQKSKVSLPDGTLVHLNYESELRFPEQFSGSIREVELIGEGFFEVEHDEDRPFIVKTGDLKTEVLGTTFNVNAIPHSSQTRVSLVSGKVKVKAKNKKAEFLSPGEELRFQKISGKSSKGHFNVEQVISWKDGVILFQDASFEEFVKRLSKWYGVDFQVYGDTPKNWKVNGRYENEKLEEILEGLQFVYDLKYKIDGKNVTIKFN